MNISAVAISTQQSMEKQHSSNYSWVIAAGSWEAGSKTSGHHVLLIKGLNRKFSKGTNLSKQLWCCHWNHPLWQKGSRKLQPGNYGVSNLNIKSKHKKKYWIHSINGRLSAQFICAKRQVTSDCKDNTMSLLKSLSFWIIKLHLNLLSVMWNTMKDLFSCMNAFPIYH